MPGLAAGCGEKRACLLRLDNVLLALEELQRLLERRVGLVGRASLGGPRGKAASRRHLGGAPRARHGRRVRRRDTETRLGHPDEAASYRYLGRSWKPLGAALAQSESHWSVHAGVRAWVQRELDRRGCACAGKPTRRDH